jgi:signal transduction histidine kinase
VDAIVGEVVALIAKGLIADASIRARIWQLAIVGCFALAALGGLLAWTLERNRDANAWVERTRIVLGSLAVYTQGLVNAETGQRGYLLTGDEAYLAPYEESVAGNNDRLGRLRALISDEIEQQKVRRLADIMDDKLRELAETIQLARGGNHAAALAAVMEGRGRRDTVEFRRLNREIVAYEDAALEKRQARAAEENRNVTIAMTIGGVAAALAILGFAANTVARIQGPLRDLMVGIGALTDGRLERRVEVRSRNEIGRVASAFNEMADHLLAANQARQRVECDLAQSNQQLLQEIADRAAGQLSLSRATVELRRSNEELDSFAYAASHDLRAPLRGIRNLADWIAEDVGDTAGPETIANLDLLRNRVERLDMLLDSLLQHSRVGRAGAAPEDVDIALLVHEIADYLAPRDGFAVAYSGEIATIHTSKAPLEQVLRNLIGNALKHHDGAAGGVGVATRDLGDRIEFRVEDDGPGIPPVFHERIFRMFQTLKSRDELEGSGMGLAIVKKSVESHGGTIRVESAPPSRGTAFVFTWEKAARPASAASASNAERSKAPLSLTG